MTGPLMIVNPQRPAFKYEAQCHRCRWVYFSWGLAELRELLIQQLDRAHVNPPDPMTFNLTAAKMPGR